jgi:predicted nucleic acid-binding protein
MIVVDTSVWVEAWRAPAAPTAVTLKQLLDADEVALALPVRIELVSGAGTNDRMLLRRALAGIPLSAPDHETWRLIESWIGPAADAGHRFSIPDLLIAGSAHELGALVWSFDQDFVAMERLGLVRLY